MRERDGERIDDRGEKRGGKRGSRVEENGEVEIETRRAPIKKEKWRLNRRENGRKGEEEGFKDGLGRVREKSIEVEYTSRERERDGERIEERIEEMKLKGEGWVERQIGERVEGERDKTT